MAAVTAAAVEGVSTAAVAADFMVAEAVASTAVAEVVAPGLTAAAAHDLSAATVRVPLAEGVRLQGEQRLWRQP